jgi:subtilisin family serine protease
VPVFGVAAVAVVAAVFVGSGSAQSRASAGGDYIVVLKPDVADVAGVVGQQEKQHGFKAKFVYSHALKGYASKLPPGLVDKLSQDPRVDYIEADGVASVDTTQASPPWGLDRIDQASLPLSLTYSYTSTGNGVTAYVIDTGIRTTHVEFGGRASWGVDEIDGTKQDCNGHGTHVAGTIGGSTYGVAKTVTLKAVRVLNCQGSGSWSQVIAGVDWVTADHIAGQRAVANMSLGGSLNSAVNQAVATSISDGVVYSIAAGNNSGNACNTSPAATPKALTVGASDINDHWASFSNFGACVDLIAPGVNVLSAWNSSDVSTNIISGTSMATPHVTGIAARLWSSNATFTPNQIIRKVKRGTTPGKIVGVPAGTVNKLAFLSAST